MRHFDSLSSRNPSLTAEELLDTFIPPTRFCTVSFENYQPDPTEPTQVAAVKQAKFFVHSIKEKPRLFRRLHLKRPHPIGIYLDGGFGVGKTHLLTSLWNIAPGPKAIGSFVEYTNLVGALGFKRTIEALSNYKVLCIDEFELDDPGDTVLMSRFMRELTERGVKIAATSNTLPGALGKGRFAAQDFKREIQGIADQFEICHIEGKDYRYDNARSTIPASSDEELSIRLEKLSIKNLFVDNFSDLMNHLPQVHPSRYKKLIYGVKAVGWKNVEKFSDQSKALRFVMLVDRLYDAHIPVLYSGINVSTLFPEEMLWGSYQKKFQRALSRLETMVQEGIKIG